MTLNERIGVLLWHNFKVFVLLRFPKGGMGGGVLQPPKHPPKSTTELVTRDYTSPDILSNTATCLALKIIS